MIRVYWKSDTGIIILPYSSHNVLPDGFIIDKMTALKSSNEILSTRFRHLAHRIQY